MSSRKNVNFPLKVVINKQKTKVLYAEADSEFADVLLSFLTLPLGTIARVLQKHDPSFLFGSITTLYKSVASLESAHFQTEVCKQMLLNPRTSSEASRHKLKFNVDDTDQPTKYLRCTSDDCIFRIYTYRGIEIKCDCCKSTLSKEIVFKDSVDQGVNDGVISGVFTKGTSHFIISDDLQILPSEMGNVVRLFRNMGITDRDEAELMDVTFGFKEIMDLLKGALLSDTPLADIVLNKRMVESFAGKYEMSTFVPPILKSENSDTNNPLVVKAIIQNSTNKLLYVESDDKFVEFLFSILTIPLGGTECLLGGSTELKNIDNLYRTLGEIDGDKYLKTKVTKNMLLNPKLPFGYTFNSQFLPLTEEIPPAYFFLYHPQLEEGCFAQNEVIGYGRKSYRTSVVFKSPKAPGNYIKEQTMYMVTDDLVVTPLCTTSGISILNHLGVPLLDVREQELNIGLEEALRILRASLTSTRVLSDGLINILLEKQPKQEQKVYKGRRNAALLSQSSVAASTSPTMRIMKSLLASSSSVDTNFVPRGGKRPRAPQVGVNATASNPKSTI